MTQAASRQLQTRELLTALVNVLHKSFVEASRTDAKARFSQMDDSKVLSLVRLEMPDQSVLDTELVVDSAEFKGRLNFSAFRDALVALIGRAVAVVKDAEKPVPTLFNEARDETLFNIPGAIVEEEQLNVMFMSVYQPSAGVMRITLMFVDPQQFKVPANNNG